MLTKEITSLQHPFIKHLVKLRTDRKYRNENKQVLISGCKLVAELAPVAILLTDDRDMSLPKADEAYFVTPAIMKKITGLEQPEPLAAVMTLPKESSLLNRDYLLILDGISDPGNMGTLLRTAVALGWQGAFLVDGCVDPFNDKAVRSGKGAQFRLPLKTGSWQELQELLSQNKMLVRIADIEGETLEAQLEPPLALVLGNEAHGASSFARKHFPSITIPMSGKMESLNVASAGAILMHTLKKT